MPCLMILSLPHALAPLKRAPHAADESASTMALCTAPMRSVRSYCCSSESSTFGFVGCGKIAPYSI